MNPLDALFLDIEDEDPRASLAISSVAVLDGPAPTDEEFLAVVRSRLPLVPRYRQKIVQLPLDLGRPLWIDDPGFDLAYHVRRTMLAEPGDDAALSEKVAEIMGSRLDRDRPLWEYWIVDGLADGRWAVVSKVHHCMVDGVSGTHLYNTIFDHSSDAEPAPPEKAWRPEPMPSAWDMAAGALRDLALVPVEQVRLLRDAVREPRATLRRVGATIQGLATLAEAAWPAVSTSLVGPLGRKRRYAIARAPLADLVAVGHKADVSFNDVALAAISGALRDLLQGRSEEPHPHAVRSLVPVSVRAPGEEGIYENRISMMLVYLPVHLDDPVDRLTAVHETVGRLKANREALAADAMMSLARHEPFPPISWGMRLASRLPQRQYTTVTTNVPGPREPLYLLGRRLIEILPYVPIATRLRVGVAVFSYCGQVTFGVTGDYDSTPEVDRVARAIERELRALVARYSPPEKPAARRRKSAVTRPALLKASAVPVTAKRPPARTVDKAANTEAARKKAAVPPPRKPRQSRTVTRQKT